MITLDVGSLLLSSPPLLLSSPPPLLPSPLFTSSISPPLGIDAPFKDLRTLVGQVQSTLVKKLSILDKYEHVLAQVNAVAMERLIDPKTQVSTICARVCMCMCVCVCACLCVCVCVCVCVCMEEVIATNEQEGICKHHIETYMDYAVLMQVNLLGVCDDPAILAQQLTHIEMVSDRNYHEFADGHTIAITSLVYSVR